MCCGAFSIPAILRSALAGKPPLSGRAGLGLPVVAPLGNADTVKAPITEVHRCTECARASCRIPTIAELGICAATASATRADLAPASCLSDRLATGLRGRRPVSLLLDICGPSVSSRPAGPSRVAYGPSHIKFLVRTAIVIDRPPTKLTPCSATPIPLWPCLSASRNIWSLILNFGTAILRHRVAARLGHEPTVASY